MFPMAVMMLICLGVVVVAIVIPLAGFGVGLAVTAAGAIVLLAGHSRLHGRGRRR